MEKAISRFAKDAMDNVFVVDERKGADITDAIQLGEIQGIRCNIPFQASMLAQNRLEQGG